MRQYNTRFLYSGPHQNEEDSIKTFFSLVPAHDGTTSVELLVGTKTLLTEVYAIRTKSGLNIDKVL